MSLRKLDSDQRDRTGAFKGLVKVEQQEAESAFMRGVAS